MAKTNCDIRYWSGVKLSPLYDYGCSQVPKVQQRLLDAMHESHHLECYAIDPLDGSGVVKAVVVRVGSIDRTSSEADKSSIFVAT